MVRWIEYVRPIMPLLPQVAEGKGQKSNTLNDKLMWTLAALALYLVCAQLPLFGVGMSRNADPFYIMRMILASSRGTLMELGISPIITSGTIMSLLQGIKVIDVDMSFKEDRELLNAVTKLLGLVITVGTATAYVLSGMYGDVRDLGMAVSVGLIVQLVFAGFLVLMLDDLLNKHGLGSGLNLFIVTGICEGIVWRCFSPTTFNAGKGTEFEGAIIAAVHSLVVRPNKLSAISDSLFRDNLPNLTSLFATALVFLVVIYIQGFRVEVPLVPTQPPARQLEPYVIKLFYTSNMPIIILSALVSNLYFFSQLLHRRYAGNVLIRLLGTWTEDTGRGSRPIGGFAYYVSPPGSFAEVVMDPFHAVVYVVFMLSACAVFAKVWVDISGSGAHDIARQLRDNKLTIRGFEREPTRRLQAIIPTAAAFGGMCVAALSIVADLLGAMGSGTGILLAVTIIYDLYEKFAAEVKQEAKTDPNGWAAQLVPRKIVYA